MSNEDPPVPSFEDVPEIPPGGLADPEPPPPQEQVGPPFPMPTHPDYQVILGLIQAGFDEIQAAGGDAFNIRVYFGQFVDPDSLITIALERSMGLFAPQPGEEARAMSVATKIATLYNEAFIAGVKYAQVKAGEAG